MPNVIDSTVINQAYDTSGNGGRKLVRLSNGWFVASLLDASQSDGYIRFYVSKDNGGTWQVLCYYNSAVINKTTPPSIVSNGTMVYGIIIFTGGYSYFSFDATTVSGLISITQLDAGQSTTADCSLAINPQGTELHATWSSKNSTYANSFNIRYAKGIINADGGVTWGVVEQVTTANNTSFGYITPSITFDGNSNPVIICNYTPNTANSLYALKKTGLNASTGSIAWTWKIIYDGGSYAQSNPSSIFVPKEINGLPNGRIYVVWHGKDSVDTSQSNIRISYSDDGGITWSSIQKLTSGNNYAQSMPSATYTKNNEIYVAWIGYSNTYPDAKNVFTIKYSSSTWGTATRITNDQFNNQDCTSVSTLLESGINITKPLYIYTTFGAGKVGFYGTWTQIEFSDTDGSLGNLTSLTKTYTVTNEENPNLTVTEKLDGNVLRTYNTTSGATNTIDLSSIWNTLSYGVHEVVIECDGNKRTWTFAKIYGTNSKPSELIGALLDLIGINQKAELKTALTNKGLSIADNDGIADMIGKLNGLELGKKWASGNTLCSFPAVTIYDEASQYKYAEFNPSLSFTPKIVFIKYTGWLKSTETGNNPNLCNASACYDISSVFGGYNTRTQYGRNGTNYEFVFSIREVSSSKIKCELYSSGLSMASSGSLYWIAFE